MQQLIQQENRIDMLGFEQPEIEDFQHWAITFCADFGFSFQDTCLGADRGQLTFRYASHDFVLFSETLCESMWIEGCHGHARQNLAELRQHLLKDTLVHNQHM